MKTHIITVHGINTLNPWYYRNWIKNIPNNKSFNIVPVKWNSWSWHRDLLRIYFSKTYRDNQITKVTKAILQTGADPVILLSHSWGTVWAYKAWHRLQKQILGQSAQPNTIEWLRIKPVWSVMVGAALGGTNLPFGGVYVNAIKGTYMNSDPPAFIHRLYNLYNKDDYVSSPISMKRMTNIKIDVGSFDPGFQEHDASHYIKTTQFQTIINQFSEIYLK